MSVTETESVLDSATPTLVFLEDATSDTEVEPPSPGGSTKGLYVRSRPTSMDGSIIEFPGFASEVDFTQFGMTAAPAATVISPIEPSFPFPTPPIIRAPPVAKRRRYAASMKSLYTGTGTGTILKTNQAPIILVKIVPRVLEDEPVTPLPAKTSGWKTLKIVPGYTGTGTGTILKTNQAPIIPVRIVPRVLEDEPTTPLPAKTSG
jgi:hypothetical protein